MTPHSTLTPGNTRVMYTWVRSFRAGGQGYKMSETKVATPTPSNDLLGGGGGLVTKLCPILATPMDCSLPGFSVHGILQARTLEWVAISFSRGSS